MDRRDVTAMLHAAQAGEPAAAEELVRVLYDELRSFAEQTLRSERRDHTLQATALVHEAYIRLISDRNRTWENRAHFFASAARAIRRILIEHARSRSRLKRGGGMKRVSLEGLPDDSPTLSPHSDDQLLSVDRLLEELAAIDPRKARVVELRFFGGLTVEEVSAVLGVSASTIAREWRMARAWLRSELDEFDHDDA